MNNHELRERETSLTAEVRNMRENIQTAIEEALNSAPERKFIETIEFSFNLKDIDLMGKKVKRLFIKLLKLQKKIKQKLQLPCLIVFVLIDIGLILSIS